VTTAQYAHNFLSPSDIVQFSSANAAASNNLTMPAIQGRWCFITGFQISGSGAVTAGIITVTVEGFNAINTFYVDIPIVSNTVDYIVTYPTPQSAAAISTPITLNVPSFGTGNTRAAANMQGFYL